MFFQGTSFRAEGIKGRSMARTVRTTQAFCTFFALLVAGIASGICQSNILHARIGIFVDSGDQTIRTNGKEKIKAGDRMRLYVQPKEICYVYVVHTDKKTVTLLEMLEAKGDGAMLVLPGRMGSYEVDGASPFEAFTIICSYQKLQEISALARSDSDYPQWIALERGLQKRGKIDLSHKSEKSFPLTGNVRELIPQGESAILRQLPIYSGNSILVKKYEFEVEK